MKKIIVAVKLLTLCLFFTHNVFAAGPNEPWTARQYPFDFSFGNHIDGHQQTMQKPDGTLLGFLYIEFTGEFTAEGYPIAEHTNCGETSAECVVGWRISGIPGRAVFVFQETGDHPLWLVDSRADIPQPGCYGHFHWLGDPQTASGLEVGRGYDGYFLELDAVRTFVFRHGSDEVLVTPGTDLATHLNIVPSFPTSSSGSGGH